MEDLIKRLRRAAKESFFLKDLLSEAADALQGVQPVKHGKMDEVPPHGRLIDADELMKRIQLYIDEYELYVDENGFHCEKWCAMKETEMAINDAPTVIPANKDGET